MLIFSGLALRNHLSPAQSLPLSMKFPILNRYLPVLAAASLCGTGISYSGEVADAGWARARLNDGADLERKKFVYPETSKPVRLYLIDSAVDNSSGWFNGNPNLTLHPSVYVGPSHTEPSADKNHGTRVLGIIAGPEIGAALGTKIEVVSYDVAKSGSGTYIGYVSGALYEAVNHFQTNPGTPSVICLAVGSDEITTDEILEDAVAYAVEAGITVITGAGNQSGSASDYIPSAYGVKDGVVCVGGSTWNNQRLPMSNQGDAVDLYAPAENVPTVNVASPGSGDPYLMTGTSAATAIAAATALTELSRNPSFTPAELENHMKQFSFTASSLAVLQLEAVPDSDGDGIDDSLETFFGSDPALASSRPDGPTPVCTDGKLCLHFTIAESLFDPANPHQLTNGATWRGLISANFEGWAEAPGKVTYGAPENGLVPITFSVTTGLARTCLRLELIAPESSIAPVPVVSLAQALHGSEWEETVTQDGAEYQALLVMDSSGTVNLELVPIE